MVTDQTHGNRLCLSFYKENIAWPFSKWGLVKHSRQCDICKILPLVAPSHTDDNSNTTPPIPASVFLYFVRHLVDLYISSICVFVVFFCICVFVVLVRRDLYVVRPLVDRVWTRRGWQGGRGKGTRCRPHHHHSNPPSTS